LDRVSRRVNGFLYRLISFSHIVFFRREPHRVRGGACASPPQHSETPLFRKSETRSFCQWTVKIFDPESSDLSDSAEQVPTGVAPPSPVKAKEKQTPAIPDSWGAKTGSSSKDPKYKASFGNRTIPGSSKPMDHKIHQRTQKPKSLKGQCALRRTGSPREGGETLCHRIASDLPSGRIGHRPVSRLTLWWHRATRIQPHSEILASPEFTVRRRQRESPHPNPRIPQLKQPHPHAV